MPPQLPSTPLTTSSQLPPLSTVLPPLILGTATFNHQYNLSPHSLPTTTIIHRALAAGITAFDTSPYYGPAELLLGAALQSSSHPRSAYQLLTKVGRVTSTTFNYSPQWIRASVARSLARLNTPYLDVVYCHDIEFVAPASVVAAITTLRALRAEGLVRYVGISGYPLDALSDAALRVLRDTGEPLDAVMSYAHYTLQNTALAERVARLCGEARVACVLSGSPLGMGLLRAQGVPVGAMGDFHPAPEGLRGRCAEASRVCVEGGEKLEKVALRFALEGWARDGAEGGTLCSVGVGAGSAGTTGTVGTVGTAKMGISVAGVSLLEELEELLAIWAEVRAALERRALEERVQRALEEWKDYSWPSGVEYKTDSKL